MNKRLFGIISFILLILVLSACGKSESINSDAKPDKIHHNFLLFTEDHVNDEGESIGDLYIQSMDSEREKIASNVKQHNYVYLNDKDKVLFLDEENNLYEFKVGEEKVKLAEDVYSFDGNYNEDIVTYQNSDFDLYILKDGEEEKIASDVYQVEIIDTDVYYSENDGDLSVYNIESRKELDIADNIEYFQLLNKDGDLVYLNDESMLYYKEVDEESIRVSGEEVNYYSIQYVDDLLIYTTYDGGEESLYVSTISGTDVTSEKIADEVVFSNYDDGSFYYLNIDGNLYAKGKKDDTATKLASDVSSFRVIDGTLYYLDEDANLNKQTKKDDKEKVASDVFFYDVHDGDVVYLNEDNELFVNKTKVASSIEEYSYYYGNLAYASKDEKLYLMKDLKDAKVAVKELSEYSTVSYQNQIVFTNTLGFEDVAGFWKVESEGDVVYLDIKDDGTFVNYLDNDPQVFTISYAGYQTMDIESDDEYLTLEKLDNETLTLTDGYESLTLKKSSEKEADQYIQDVLFQEDVEEVKYTISEYLYAFTDAIYYGEPNGLGYYVDENSAFYQEQVDFITQMYESNIEEEVLDYEFKEVNSIDKDTLEVVVNEKFAIYKYDEDWVDFTEETVDQTSTYTLKRMDGSFYITDLTVSTN